MEIDNAELLNFKGLELAARLREEEKKGLQAAKLKFEAQAKLAREREKLAESRKKLEQKRGAGSSMNRLAITLMTGSLKQVVNRQKELQSASRALKEVSTEQAKQAAATLRVKARLDKVNECFYELKSRLMDRKHENETESILETFSARKTEPEKSEREEFCPDRPIADCVALPRAVAYMLHEASPCCQQSYCGDPGNGPKNHYMPTGDSAAGNGRKGVSESWSRALQHALNLDGRISDLKQSETGGVKALELTYVSSSGAKIQMAVKEVEGKKLLLTLSGDKRAAEDLSMERSSLLRTLKERGVEIENVIIKGSSE